jgi:6-pyruvoyltetrahydropterin/6-carboxytetrahydropterin synthase
MQWRVIKKWGTELGLSCTYRQHRADSHCQFLHGYALSVSIEFSASELDKNGWVIDFGGLKHLRAFLVERFDHKTLVAEDDPQLAWFDEADARGLIQLAVVKRTGLEAFAAMIGTEAMGWLSMARLDTRVRVEAVEVQEHPANTAIYLPWA